MRSRSSRTWCAWRDEPPKVVGMSIFGIVYEERRVGRARHSVRAGSYKREGRRARSDAPYPLIGKGSGRTNDSAENAEVFQQGFRVEQPFLPTTPSCIHRDLSEASPSSKSNGSLGALFCLATF